MLNERAQVVLSVQPLLGEDDRRLVTDALLRLEGVRTAHVDVPRGVVRVDGAASDVEVGAPARPHGSFSAPHIRGLPVRARLPAPDANRLRCVCPQLLATMEALGKRAAVVTHTRGLKPAAPQSGGMLKLQLFMKLLGRQAVRPARAQSPTPSAHLVSPFRRPRASDRHARRTLTASSSVALLPLPPSDTSDRRTVARERPLPPRGGGVAHVLGFMVASPQAYVRRGLRGRHRRICACACRA